MTRTTLRIASTTLLLGIGSSASAQWVNYVNETATRMPTGAGQNNSATSTLDPRERDYAWGDIDNDGDVDLVSVRKQPFTFATGYPNVLFLNENGALMDRTSTKANTSINVPGSELTAAGALVPPMPNTSQGMLDITNDRDVLMVDVNNDGWLDVVTATTISDVNNSNQPYMLPRFLGHPRVYMNQGEIAGTWQGLVYDYNRMPQLLSKTGFATHPRFCSLAFGDVTGDGYGDLYFGDYDTGEVGPAEPAGSDFDHKLLINLGAANPGVFVDQSTARMGAIFNYPDGNVQNLLFATFGAASQIGDMNGDGVKDVIKQTSLVPPQHVAVLTNPSPFTVPVGSPGTWPNTSYKIVYSLSAYFVSHDDLNGDGRLDLIMSDDNTDRYLINTGNDANGQPNFTQLSFSTAVGGGDSFGSQSVAADLNNDGWKDVLISDMDVDGFGFSRRLKIYRNQGNAPNVTLREDSPSVIATASLASTYYVAPIDVDSDGWKDLVMARANVNESAGTTTVWMNRPKIVSFAFPNGKPANIVPDTATSFDVVLSGLNGSTVVAGSGKIHISTNGGAYVATNMTVVSGNSYSATLPAVPCGTNLRYYFSGQSGETGNPTYYNPWRASTLGLFYPTTVASSTTTVLNEGFEAGSPGWVVTSDAGLTSGAWAVADPVGTWNDGIRISPETDNTPAAGVNAFVTQNGAVGGALSAADVDGGSTRLMSPAIDLAGTNGTITYAYWFYGNTFDDSLSVQVSNNDGANWSTVLVHKGPGTAVEPEQTKWQTASFAVGDYIAPTATVRVRFVATDSSPESLVEAGIDDFRVDRMDCQPIEPPACPADIAPVGGNDVVNVEDLLAVIGAWGPCANPNDCPADIAPAGGNDLVNVEDLLGVIAAWGACPTK